jgi:hypothetical protein
MKRYRAGTAGRGRGRPYRRRMSHIKIVVSDEGMVNVPVTMPAPKVETFEKVEAIEAAEIKEVKEDKAKK